MNKILILLIILTCLCACSKKNTLTPLDVPSIDTTKVFDQKRQTNIDSNGTVSAGNNLIYQNLLITSGDIDKPSSLFAWDINTGSKVWELKLSNFRFVVNMQIKSNILLVNTLREVLALDLDTRQVLWSENLSNQGFNADNGMTITDHDVYFVWNTYKDWNRPFGSVAIFKYDIRSGFKEKIFGFGLDEEGWEPSVSEVCFWQDPVSKDSILLVNKDGSNSHTSPQEQPTDFYAINIRTKKVLWHQKKYCLIATNQIYAPVVYGDDVIVAGDWSIYSFDIPTGKLNWRTQFPNLGNFGSFNNTQHLLVGERLFVNPDAFDVMCLNAKTGAVLWHNTTDAPNCTQLMHYYKDMLVYTSWGLGSVMVLDALTGHKIHKQKPPDKSTFYANITYDPVTDMFFTQTYYSVYGFKINKPK